MRYFPVAKGSATHFAQNLFVGQAPLRLFIGLMTEEEFSGTINTNPLCYRPHGVQTLTLSIDNRTIYPVQKPGGEHKLHPHCYRQYVKTLRALNSKEEVIPTLREYWTGPMTLFGWDLSADFSSNSDCTKIGALSLNLTFDVDTTLKNEGLTAVVMGFFHATLFMDSELGVALYDAAIDETDDDIVPTQTR
jgi:hypothetical protein